jgi:hypothetical protein
VSAKPLFDKIGATTPPEKVTVTPLKSLPTTVIVLPTTPLVGENAITLMAFGRLSSVAWALKIKLSINPKNNPNITVGFEYSFFISFKRE